MKHLLMIKFRQIELLPQAISSSFALNKKEHQVEFSPFSMGLYKKEAEKMSE